MEVHDHADVIVALLVLTNHLFIIGVHQEGQHGALNAKGRLDDVGIYRVFFS